MALTANAGSSSRSTVILAAVIVLHIGIFYGIQSGLAHKVVELLPQDIQTKIIEEEKPKEEEPPPPPPPDMKIEPPPFVPPPEVSVMTTPAPNAITNVVTTPPPPAPPPVAAAPARQTVVAPPKMDVRRSRSCDEYYPAASSRAEEEGVVQVRCYVGLNGRCDQISISKGSGFDRLDEAAQRCAKDLLRFEPQTKDGQKEAAWYDFNVRFKMQKR